MIRVHPVIGCESCILPDKCPANQAKLDRLLAEIYRNRREAQSFQTIEGGGGGGGPGAVRTGVMQAGRQTVGQMISGLMSRLPTFLLDNNVPTSAGSASAH